MFPIRHLFPVQGRAALIIPSRSSLRWLACFASLRLSFFTPALREMGLRAPRVWIYSTCRRRVGCRARRPYIRTLTDGLARFNSRFEYLGTSSSAPPGATCRGFRHSTDFGWSGEYMAGVLEPPLAREHSFPPPLTPGVLNSYQSVPEPNIPPRMTGPFSAPLIGYPRFSVPFTIAFTNPFFPHNPPQPYYFCFKFGVDVRSDVGKRE